MRNRPTFPARALALCLALAAGALGMTGCGINADGEPKAIAPADLPADLLDPNPPTTTTIEASTSTAPVTVYLVLRQGDTTLLSPVTREVANSSRPADRINAVLLPTSAQEQALGLISSIPTDTVLLSTAYVPADNELVVNLSGALFNVQGKELANAFAQLVWTVTELDGIRQVRFRVDSQAYRAPNAEGVEQEGAVTRGDYNSLAPPR